MKHTRLAAGLAATLMAASGLVVATTVSAQANPDAKIWGRSVDGKGRAVLNVNVHATGDTGGEASDLSYDVTDPGHSPLPGYFGLFPGTNGTYTVKLAKEGFEPVRLTGVTVSRHHRVVGVGEVTMLRTSNTSAVVTNEVHVGDKAKVKVTVGPGKPSGHVSISLGKKELASDKLVASDGGVLRLTLPKQAKGSYTLKASFDGGALYAPSSKTFTLTVKKAASRSQVPNARPAII